VYIVTVQRAGEVSRVEEEISSWLDRVATTLYVDNKGSMVDLNDPIFAKFAGF